MTDPVALPATGTRGPNEGPADRQGLTNAADLAMIGDEAHVTAGLEAYLTAGATDVTVIYSHLGGEDDRCRTWALLGDLERAHAL